MVTDLFRNCLVYARYGVKISDCGSVRSVYNCDYYTTQEGARLPVRWMSWESVVLVSRLSSCDLDPDKVFFKVPVPDGGYQPEH